MIVDPATGRRLSPPAIARRNAGLSVADAAKRAGVTEGYIRLIDARGRASERLARRLARLYGCRMEIFLLRAAETI